MNKPILECNGIAAGYVKDLDILQGVDLVVNQNEIVSIIGPNGAGKSTLLKAIMGIINISAPPPIKLASIPVAKPITPNFQKFGSLNIALFI